MIYTAGNPRPPLSASEALYGFGGWLTTRDTSVTMSAHDDCAIVAELIDKFCQTNDLKEPRDDWSDNLTHPKD